MAELGEDEGAAAEAAEPVAEQVELAAVAVEDDRAQAVAEADADAPAAGELAPQANKLDQM